MRDLSRETLAHQVAVELRSHDDAFHLETIRLLARGRPVSLRELAMALHRSREEVQQR